MCSNITASPAYGIYTGQYQLFWFPETSSLSEKEATGPGLWKYSPYSIC
jgi:hypothetical protein